MARRAVILYLDRLGSREVLLGRMLDFFGVPWKSAEASELDKRVDFGKDCAVFGSIRAIATLEPTMAISKMSSVFAYMDDLQNSCLSALQRYLPDAEIYPQSASTAPVSVCVSDERPDFAGPMAGLHFSMQTPVQLTFVPRKSSISAVSTLISADSASTFIRFPHQGVCIFFNCSSQMLDIDQSVDRFYDIKKHFFSVVPLVMFIKFYFPDVAWHPLELSACLIIDDPLLKLNYGFCDFARLGELMQEHQFTTNIAFIPWNWRRTSHAGGKFFAEQPRLFSISVHGCDHTAGEFASISPDVLRSRARLALTRMQEHSIRTGIQHVPVMIFPQGAFSSVCPEILKRNGFIAAVNTEVAPTDSQNAHTKVRDAWDVAIMSYGDFPVFTRRYPSHGLENFAFDLLLGKPCLIVTHHEFFKDGCVALIELIDKIKSLNCCLHWRPLGEVIRRACRSRAASEGTQELEMYGNELILENDFTETIQVVVRKRKSDGDLISGIFCDQQPIAWSMESNLIVFASKIAPQTEKLFSIKYEQSQPLTSTSRSLRFEMSVAARRILSEIGDEYLSTNRFLSIPASKMKSILRRTV